MSASEISVLVASYIVKRDERLAKQREVDALAEEENLLKEQIIADLNKNKVPVIGSDRGTVKLQRKIKPIAGDWNKFYDYVHDTRGYDLLQRRLMESAIKARWDDGIAIPGVTEFVVFDLSISDKR